MQESFSRKRCSLRITARLALLVLLMTCRAAWVLIEQPLSSTMTSFPYIMYLENLFGRLGFWGQTSLCLALQLQGLGVQVRALEH